MFRPSSYPNRRNSSQNATSIGGRRVGARKPIRAIVAGACALAPGAAQTTPKVPIATMSRRRVNIGIAVPLARRRCAHAFAALPRRSVQRLQLDLGKAAFRLADDFAVRDRLELRPQIGLLGVEDLQRQFLALRLRLGERGLRGEVVVRRLVLRVRDLPRLLLQFLLLVEFERVAAVLGQAFGRGGKLGLLRRGSRTPAALIADYHLDQGTGIEAIRQIRNELSMELPAVVITADRLPAVQQEVEALGVPMLSKPVRPAQLRSLLAAILERQAA